jgi:soluble lytic murein transglycosylase-like protein
MRWKLGVTGSVVLLLALVSVPDARADVWLKRDGSGTLQFTNAPTSGNTTFLFRELPRTNSGRRRTDFRRGRVGPPTAYDGLIEQIAERHTVDVALVKAVIRAESGFNPTAISPKGARGLMQLMPATAARHNVRNVFSPSQNIEGGVEHLRMLLDLYAGNVVLALAAYNAGIQAVDAAGRKVPPYRETREYVTRVLAYRAAYLRNPQAHSVLSRR